MRLTISTSTGSAAEVSAAERLTLLLDGIDLARFTYTGEVVIDAAARTSHSHPVLTLRPDNVLGRHDDVVLTTYLHEQMHWAANTMAGFSAAIDEVTARWPQPPGPREGGAADSSSTWLHFGVCALEIAAMSDVVGESGAVAAVSSLPWYRWIYERLLGDDLPWRAYLERQGLVLPVEPPRHASDVTWVLEAEADALRNCVGDLAQLLADRPLEPDLIVRILALCCLMLDGRDAESAAAIDRRNAELYPRLARRRDDVERAVTHLKRLRDP